MAKLVIVESPAKAKTIGKYLGKDYEVTASMGHIRDLPPPSWGLMWNTAIRPQYINIKGKEKLIRELKSKAKKGGRRPAGHRPGPGRRGHQLAPGQPAGHRPQGAQPGHL